MATMDGLMQLLDREIPEARRHLGESHINLERVASYCEGNYLQASDKPRALEETKNYTTQSLASVAYQINTLATNFLNLLDLQLHQMEDMESSVNNLAQTVAIHKEKVARREIGVLTTNKTTSRPTGVKNPGIIFPDQSERPVKYVRRSIDYSQLDEVGHGVKVQQVQTPHTRRASSGSSRSSVTGAGLAPTTKPPTPPALIRGTNTLTRQTSSPYRTPTAPVVPPSVPSHYAPSYPMQQQPPPQQQQQQQPPVERRSGYAPVGHVMTAAPPTKMVHPMAHMASPSSAPPPPPVPSIDTYNEPPPPPLPESAYHQPSIDNLSPPLPPPPEQTIEAQYSPPPPPPNESQYGPSRVQYDFEDFSMRMRAPLQENVAEWVPRNYLEKVVAIYDYVKDKDDELSFPEGAVIFVSKKNDDGWWEGVMDGVTGLFPGNYVEGCI